MPKKARKKKQEWRHADANEMLRFEFSKRDSCSFYCTCKRPFVAKNNTHCYVCWKAFFRTTTAVETIRDRWEFLFDNEKKFSLQELYAEEEKYESILEQREGMVFKWHVQTSINEDDQKTLKHLEELIECKHKSMNEKKEEEAVVVLEETSKVETETTEIPETEPTKEV